MSPSRTVLHDVDGTIRGQPQRLRMAAVACITGLRSRLGLHCTTSGDEIGRNATVFSILGFVRWYSFRLFFKLTLC